MINKHDLTNDEVINLFNTNGIHYKIINNEFSCILPFQNDFMQGVINKYWIDKKEIIPSLSPVQFHYMLIKSSLETAMLALLEMIKEQNIDQYALYKSYLTVSRYYDFEPSYIVYYNIKDKLLLIDPTLDFTKEQLKVLWYEAANII